MRSIGKGVDGRDVASLLVALFSLVGIACYWLFYSDKMAHEYNASYYSAYRFVFVPLAVASASFFASSRCTAGARAEGLRMGAAKAVCLLLVAAYVASLAALALAGASLPYEVRIAVTLFLYTFLPYVEAPVGLVLGVRMT